MKLAYCDVHKKQLGNKSSCDVTCEKSLNKSATFSFSRTVPSVGGISGNYWTTCFCNQGKK